MAKKVPSTSAIDMLKEMSVMKDKANLDRDYELVRIDRAAKTPAPGYLTSAASVAAGSISSPMGHGISGALPPAAAAPSEEDDIMAIISKYGASYKEIAESLGVYDDPAEKKEADPVEPEFKPIEMELSDGMISLKDLVKGADDVPVRVFNELDWPEEIRSYIPKQLPNDGKWHWNLELLKQLAFSLYCGERTLLHGPTGTGKSALIEAWCHLTKTPFIRVNCHPDMQSSDFLGKDVIRSTPSGPVLEYEWSMTTLAARFGGMLLIDEAFRSPHLMAIQSLLERNGTLTLPDAASLTPDQRHIVPPSGKSWLVLTDNNVGVGDESGAYISEVQDVSTLDRITAAIHIGYTPSAQECKELKKDYPAVPVKDVLKPLCDWAAKMREAFISRTAQQPVSRRAINSILRKYLVTGDLDSAAQLSYLNKLGTSDIVVAKEAWMQVFGKELNQTAKNATKKAA